MYFPAYRGGHLLVDGGLAAQPARYVDMMQAIAGLVDAVEQKYVELTREQES
jgi:hypothetical protein